MAAAATLRDIPEEIGEKFLPYYVTLRQRRNARKFCKESCINSVRIFRHSNTELVVKASIFRSQKKTEEGYTTTITVEAEKKVISDAFCKCKAGTSGECAHVLALVMKLADWLTEGLQDVPMQPACTTLPQQWDRPRGPKILPEPVSTMVIAKPGNAARKKRPLTAVFNDNRKIQLLDRDVRFLHSLKDCPLSYLVHIPEQTIQTTSDKQFLGSTLAHQLPLMQPVDIQGCKTDCGDLVLPRNPDVDIPDCVINDVDRWTALSVNQCQAEAIELNTRDQSKSNDWHVERSSRITASTFGSFMVRKAAFTEKFVRKTVMPTSFQSVSTTYGMNSEKIAINMYRKKSGNHVHECGFVINPLFPFIGATPDGKVCENGQAGILEVKCSFSIRDWSIKDAVKNYEKKENLFLEESGDSIILSRTHKHWYQVQGQLLVTGANFCDFVTFTKNDLNVERIYPDKAAMKSILLKMHSVFVEYVTKF